MSGKRILTNKQIQEGKELRKKGLTKAQLAEHFGIGQTTVWENIFSTSPRVRIYHKRILRKKICVPCSRCEICMTQVIKDNYIPLNLQVGSECLNCYLRKMGLEFIDIIDQE